MPVVNFNTKADFDAQYRIGVEGLLNLDRPNSRPEVKLGYHRAVMLPLCEGRADRLVELFAWPLDTRILIMGAGFGWTAECLEAKGYTQIVSTDTSDYIQDNKSGTEESEIDVRISAAGLDPASGNGLRIKNAIHDGGLRSRTAKGVLDESLSGSSSRDRIKTSLGGDASVVITEAMLSTLTNGEAQSISTRANAMGVSVDVIHLVVTLRDAARDPAYNWKTIEDWKALIPADTFVEAGTFRVL